MDIQYLGGVLLARQDIQLNRDGFTNTSVVDAYYEHYAHAHWFFLKLASFVVAVGVVLLAVGIQ
jgi:hypothetical protein